MKDNVKDDAKKPVGLLILTMQSWVMKDSKLVPEAKPIKPYFVQSDITPELLEFFDKVLEENNVRIDPISMSEPWVGYAKFDSESDRRPLRWLSEIVVYDDRTIDICPPRASGLTYTQLWPHYE